MTDELPPLIGLSTRARRKPFSNICARIATENAAVVQALIDNLAARGLDPAVPRLFIIDGSIQRLDWNDKPRSYRLLKAVLHALRDWLPINESADFAGRNFRACCEAHTTSNGDGAINAHFDKGVLHLTIKKPAKAIKTIKTKTGAPPNKAA